MIKKIKKFLLLILAMTTLVKSAESSQFVDFIYYYDTRDYNVYTIYTRLQPAPRWTYFSLVNYESSVDTLRNFDHETFYTEQNLTYSFEDFPVAPHVQWVLNSGVQNDLIRVGAVLFVSRLLSNVFQALNGFYSVFFHFLQMDFTNGYQWQIEHAYRIAPFSEMLDGRLYLGGFVDHNIGPGTSVVTAHRFGIRTFGEFYLSGEYRYNGFSSSKKGGWRAGVEYAVKF